LLSNERPASLVAKFGTEPLLVPVKQKAAGSIGKCENWYIEERFFDLSPRLD
jgi:hypothetical protein